MKCEKVLEQYLEYDHDNVLPMNIRVHLFFCERCRRETGMYEHSLADMRGESPFHLRESIADNIMHGILLTGKIYKRRVGLPQWIIVGMVILSSIFLISYSNSISWISLYFGRSFLVPLHLVLGIGISLYVALFIGSLIISPRVKGENKPGNN